MFILFTYSFAGTKDNNCGGMRIQSSNKVGKGISEKGNFARNPWIGPIFTNKEFGMLPLMKILRTPY